MNSVLAYIPSPPQGVWHLGPFPLRAYALFIILGIVVAIWWGERRWRERGGQPGAVLDVAMFAVPFGLVGGRIYHVATDWQKYFGEGKHPVEALYIWQGGLGIWGAVFFGAIGAWIGCRMYKIPLPALGDAVAPAVLLAQAIGRLGNYFNQELYGRATEVPWGLEIYERFDPETGARDMMNGVSTGRVLEVVHPTFLYELVWNVLIVIGLVLLDKRYKIGHGRLFALYVAGYSFGRFFVELLRSDEATQILGIRINSFTSALVFLGAMAYFALATKGRETPAQLQPDGEPRPWPWQFSALRAAGAAGSTVAATESEAAAVDVTKKTDSAAVEHDSVDADVTEPAGDDTKDVTDAKGAADAKDAEDVSGKDSESTTGTSAEPTKSGAKKS
ncbi:prolipoprotein diacylglyceryl transferase [Nocardia sp. NPDC058519]|uniref:prolipoprotein diacylglyceryl transferase n=1 Tax=Nocardia sp. NPDC058519 TaxID=3346535 RepID=UPI0036532A37